MEKRVQRLQDELDTLNERIAACTARAQEVQCELDLIDQIKDLTVGDVIKFKRRGISGEFTGTVVGWYPRGARVLLGTPEDRELINVPNNSITGVGTWDECSTATG